MLDSPSSFFCAPLLCQGSRGKQHQFICCILVETADGKTKGAKFFVDSGPEVNLVGKCFLQMGEARISAKSVQLEGISGHCLEGGEKETDLAVRLLKQSFWKTDDVKEEWLSCTFSEAIIK